MLQHKYAAIKIALENFGAYITYLEQLTQTDSKPEKQAQIKGWLIQWKESNLLLYMSVLLDVLAPLLRLTLALQAEKHNQVKQVCCIQDFTWTMAKLQTAIENTLDYEDKHITYYKRFRDSLTVKTAGKTSDTFYQGIKLKNYSHYQDVKQIRSLYIDLITRITHTMSDHFNGLKPSPVFKHMVALLDASTWTKNTTTYTEKALTELAEHFKPLLVKNNCVMEKLELRIRIIRIKCVKKLYYSNY